MGHVLQAGSEVMQSSGSSARSGQRQHPGGRRRRSGSSCHTQAQGHGVLGVDAPAQRKSEVIASLFAHTHIIQPALPTPLGLMVTSLHGLLVALVSWKG